MTTKHFKPNILGRDFVIGDLHGAYERFTQVMEHINFDTSIDRMFSVGDLVDRGPQNWECLALLNEPWFHAVYANHEDMMVQYHNRQPYGRYWHHNGGTWGMTLLSDEQSDLVEKAKNLPRMITVDDSFHIIHAELEADAPLEDSDFDMPDMFEFISSGYAPDGDCIIWGRQIFMDLYGKEITPEVIAEYTKEYERCNWGALFGPGLSPIYSGHTIMRQPTQIGKQTNIDTGAYHSLNPERYPWAGLTVAEPQTGQVWVAKNSGVTETKVLKIV